jgi:hypothetical protein
MGRRLRVVTAILLGLAALVLIGFAVYVLAMRDASVGERELRSWAPWHRALFVVAHARHATAGAMVLLAGGVGALAMTYVLLRGRARWPLVVVPAAAIALVFVGQWLRQDIEASEPPGYRERSVYVHAARTLATAGTGYLLALALVALAAWWLSRPRSAPSPSA